MWLVHGVNTKLLYPIYLSDKSNKGSVGGVHCEPAICNSAAVNVKSGEDLSRGLYRYRMT
jgi:hypothetical protein